MRERTLNDLQTGIVFFVRIRCAMMHIYYVEDIKDTVNGRDVQ